MPSPAPLHPRDALFDGDAPRTRLLTCDHYAGTPARIRKSLLLQAEMAEAVGRVVFDVTLDCEDGAPLGGELEHAHRLAATVASPLNVGGHVGIRTHPFSHPLFAAEVDCILRHCGPQLAYLMLPKATSWSEVDQACAFIDQTAQALGYPDPLPPIHALIETHGALRDVTAIAQHPRIASLSFGLMDFVSAHGGAIPHSAMSAQGQFHHPLVMRAKLEIAAACHGAGKVASHNVVTEFKDLSALQQAAHRARTELGYTRMWSIHPQQIAPILAAFAPDTEEVALAADLLLAAQAAQWAPVRFTSQGQDRLHDRASYRYFWHVLDRAHRTGLPLPEHVMRTFFDTSSP